MELGIACEACHGPAEEHVRFYRSPVRRYLQLFRTLQGQDAPDPTITNSEDPEDPLLLEVLETEPTALEDKFWLDGTIRVAGREYNALLESPGHRDELTCLSCHSMHEYEVPDTQLDPDFTGNRSCLGCHTDYADEISEHTRHLPGSSGSECMNCHMPHTTFGFFSAMRSHRIDSPRIQASLESGRPNACNLCLDGVLVKETVGHSDLRTTIAYTHLSREHLKALVSGSEERPPEAKELQSLVS